MTALHEVGSPRKRIKTYGKAIRKRLPSYISYQTSQEAGSDTTALKQAPVTSALTDPISATSSPLLPSMPSANMNMFDVPSSDEEATATVQKRRKTANSVGVSRKNPVKDTLEPSRSLGRDDVTDNEGAVEGSTATGLTGNTPMDDQQKSLKLRYNIHSPPKGYAVAAKPQHSPGQRHFITIPQPQPRKPERTLESQAKRAKHGNAQPIDLANEASSTVSKPSQLQADVSTTPRKINPADFEQRPWAPNASSLHDGGADTAKTPQSTTPGVLTPKGMKMWNGLLGEDSDDALETAQSKPFSEQPHNLGNDHRRRRRNGSLPRKRLIDSLGEQSKDSRYVLDLFSESEKEDSIKSNFAAPDVTGAEDRENIAEKSVSIRTAPERINAIGAAAAGQSSQTSGPKITYSRQRSMLAEKDLAEEMTFGIPLHEGLPEIKLQKRRGSIPILVPLQSLHEDDKAEDVQAGVAIRTMHELRQAGAQSRFIDEVEDLLELIGSPAQQASPRRSGLMDLVERMKDKDFCSKFLSNGMDQRLFLHLGQEEDVISGFLMISLLIIMLNAGITPVAVAQLRQQGIARLLIRLINVEENITILAKDRERNMSKSAQTMISENVQNLLRLRVWDDILLQSISPRTASLRCLELMVRQSREAGNTGDIISKELMGKLFAILKMSCNDKRARKDAVDIQLALSTLESHSLNAMMALDEYLPIIKDILEMKLASPSEGANVVLLLRLVLNATSGSSTASDIFASPRLLHLMCRAVIEKFKSLTGFVIEEERLALVDHLVLMLNVMINFAECSTLARECIHTLHDSSLADLVQIFLDNIERSFEADSVEDSHLNVAGGYLAVFLGYLSLSPDIEQRIRMQQRTKTLEPLIACIDEFLSHHKKVDDLFKDEGEHNPQAGLTERLQRLVDMMKEKEGNKTLRGM